MVLKSKLVQAMCINRRLPTHSKLGLFIEKYLYMVFDPMSSLVNLICEIQFELKPTPYIRYEKVYHNLQRIYTCIHVHMASFILMENKPAYYCCHNTGKGRYTPLAIVARKPVSARSFTPDLIRLLKQDFCLPSLYVHNTANLSHLMITNKYIY